MSIYYRLKSFLVLFLRLSLLFSIPVHAQSGIGSAKNGTAAACRKYLLQGLPAPKHPQTMKDLLSALDAPFEEDDPFFSLPTVSIMYKEFPKKPAVLAEHVSVGESGEGYYLFRRIGNTWRTLSGPNFFAVESDPTWIISALGPRVAAFFGFRLMSSDLTKHKSYRVLSALGSRAAELFGFHLMSSHFMYAPNSVLFNQRIEAMNLLLRRKGFEEISVRWTEKFQPASSPDGIPLSYAERYVREFLFGNRSPFAANEIVHDTAHHALEVLGTQDQLAPIKARMGTLIKFADFVRGLEVQPKAYPLLSNVRFREAVIALLFQTQARERDNLSGHLPRFVLDDSGEALENVSFYRTMMLHLGPEFAGTSAESFSISPNKPYTLSQWFHNLLFRKLLPLIENNSLQGGRDYSALQLLRSYTDKAYRGAIGELQHNTEQLRTELESLYKRFSDTELAGDLDLVLVEYDKNLDVVGGIAAKEHPRSALERRIREFKIAIGE